MGEAPFAQKLYSNLVQFGYSSTLKSDHEMALWPSRLSMFSFP